jgi:phage gp36-like protein
MSYITLAEAKQYLGDIYESAYINVTTDLVDDTILQDDIDAVTAVIDSYVKQVYNQVLTGAQTLQMMRSISEQLLYAKAYERFDSSDVPDYVRDRYDRGIFRLKDIQSGAMILVDETQAPRGSSFGFGFDTEDSTGSGRRVFSRSKMTGY